MVPLRMFASYNRNFWITCIAMFLFMTSFNLILPELNQYLTQLGGGDKKGLIISLFTISAGLSRPFSGKLADYIGRKPVMLIGTGVCIAVCLLYPLAATVWGFLLLRFLHGFSAGFMPTGATALVTDLLPENKRGVGMGIWGTFISLGIGVGQWMGSPIHSIVGFNYLFVISGSVALVSILLLNLVRESLEKPVAFQWEHLRVKRTDIFEPSVRPAAMVMFLSASSSGIIFVLTPEISGFLGIQNKGWFFGLYVISTIGVRLIGGDLSDRIGRRETLIIGNIVLVSSMLLIAYAHDIWSYSIAAIVFGLATGVNSPTLFAWTADLSKRERRGVGAGTLFIALEAGIMTGSLITLATYHNKQSDILWSFFLGAIMAGMSIAYLFWHRIKFPLRKVES
jgi:MFS family permease